MGTEAIEELTIAALIAADGGYMNTEAIEELIRAALIAARKAGFSRSEFDAAVERVKADSRSWAGIE